jgi:hypothetical protein
MEERRKYQKTIIEDTITLQTTTRTRLNFMSMIWTYCTNMLQPWASVLLGELEFKESARQKGTDDFRAR